MDRRQALRQVLIVTAGVSLLPACGNNSGSASIPLKAISITEKEEAFLAKLADAIIPPTDTPGAAELGAHLFALRMVDDCFSSEEQAKFTAGLKLAEEKGADPAALEADENIKPFLNAYKRLVIQGYTQSEYVMTNLLPYQLVPGKYLACVPVSNQSSS